MISQIFYPQYPISQMCVTPPPPPISFFQLMTACRYMPCILVCTDLGLDPWQSSQTNPECDLIETKLIKVRKMPHDFCISEIEHDFFCISELNFHFPLHLSISTFHIFLPPNFHFPLVLQARIQGGGAKGALAPPFSGEKTRGPKTTHTEEKKIKTGQPRSKIQAKTYHKTH